MCVEALIHRYFSNSQMNRRTHRNNKTKLSGNKNLNKVDRKRVVRSEEAQKRQDLHDLQTLPSMLKATATD